MMALMVRNANYLSDLCLLGLFVRSVQSRLLFGGWGRGNPQNCLARWARYPLANFLQISGEQPHTICGEV
jgi:hypothetical protein